MRSLNIIEGTNSLEIDVWFLDMDFCFTFVKWLVFWIDLRKHVDITEKRFSVYILPISYDFKKNLIT